MSASNVFTVPLCIIIGAFDTLGVASSDLASDSRLSDGMCEGRRSIGVVDESRRLVSERTEATEDERSVNDRADAFERDLACFKRLGRTVSGASSNVS